jgi:hypothetical protein
VNSKNIFQPARIDRSRATLAAAPHSLMTSNAPAAIDVDQGGRARRID